MSIANDTIAVDLGTHGIVEILSREQAERIVEFSPPADLQGRIAGLAEKANEGTLTEEERSAYEGFVRANSFIAALKARARRFLAEHSP
jgi:hypothetical protein